MGKGAETPLREGLSLRPNRKLIRPCPIHQVPRIPPSSHPSARSGAKRWRNFCGNPNNKALNYRCSLIGLGVSDSLWRSPIWLNRPSTIWPIRVKLLTTNPLVNSSFTKPIFGRGCNPTAAVRTPRGWAMRTGTLNTLQAGKLGTDDHGRSYLETTNRSPAFPAWQGTGNELKT